MWRKRRFWKASQASFRLLAVPLPGRATHAERTRLDPLVIPDNTASSEAAAGDGIAFIASTRVVDAAGLACGQQLAIDCGKLQPRPFSAGGQRVDGEWSVMPRRRYRCGFPR